MMANRPTTCVCVTTADQQWQELYRLQYPTHLPITLHEALASDQPDGIEPISMIRNDSPNSAQNPEEVDVLIAHSVASDPSGTTACSHNIPIPAAQDMTKLHAEIHEMRQQMHRLEQLIVSKPTSREEDLELTLGIVWQAFCRTGSADSQPETPIWRLVRRNAPSVLSSGSTAPTAHPGVSIITDQPGSNEWSDVDWPLMDLWAPSKVLPAYQEYGSYGR